MLIFVVVIHVCYLQNLINCIYFLFSNIGNWEKHTRGIGAKLLGKVIHSTYLHSQQLRGLFHPESISHGTRIVTELKTNQCLKFTCRKLLNFTLQLMVQIKSSVLLFKRIVFS